MRFPSLNKVKPPEKESVLETGHEAPDQAQTKPEASEQAQTKTAQPEEQQQAPVKDDAARFEDNMKYVVRVLTAHGMPMVLRSEQQVQMEEDASLEIHHLLEENEALKLQVSKSGAAVSEGDEYLLKAASFYHMRGMSDKALGIFDQILERTPTKMAALNNKGVVMDAGGKYEKALQCFDKALESVPENVHLLSNKGITLYKYERYQQALECFDAALKIDSGYVNALTFKAHALYRLGKNSEALDLYNRVIRLDNNNAEALYNKACLCSLKGDEYGAITSLEKAVRLDRSWRDAASQDRDLERIRPTQRFKNIVN